MHSWELDVPFPPAGPHRVFDLAQPLEIGMPRFSTHPPFGFTMSKRHTSTGTSAVSEVITIGTHVGTHIDAYGHIARDGFTNDGQPVTDSWTGGVASHPIDDLATIAATAHLVDMTALLGRQMHPAEAVTEGHLETWFSAHPRPDRGSVVLIRTGWDERRHDPEAFSGGDRGAPGVNLDAARWMSAHGLRAAGTDTFAFEVLPSAGLEVHAHLLVDAGVSIIETLQLGNLADSGATSFFLVVAPLRIRGATGSPVRPLAYVPAM